MAVVRAFDIDGYRPAYSMLILADTNQAWDPDEDPPVPHHRDRGDKPTGAFAGTGAGWIAAQAPGLSDHTVRIELHDAPPAADHADFDDVLEAPFRSSSGELVLTDVTGGYGEADLHLGATEWFRVRVARRPADGYFWLIRFWPDPVREPPVWLARSAETGDAPADVAGDIAALLRWTPLLPWEGGIAELAERLRVSEAAVRGALAEGSLHVAGEDPVRLSERRPGAGDA